MPLPGAATSPVPPRFFLGMALAYAIALAVWLAVNTRLGDIYVTDLWDMKLNAPALTVASAMICFILGAITLGRGDMSVRRSLALVIASALLASAVVSAEEAIGFVHMGGTIGEANGVINKIEAEAQRILPGVPHGAEIVEFFAIPVVEE